MATQRELNLFRGKLGGRRPDAGRKRVHSKGVAHTKRERLNSRTPLHLNFKFRCSIKNKQCLKLLGSAIRNARKHGLRIIHYSLQSNHVHLIAEAPTNDVLTKGMRSLTITFAKGLGKGRVQMERYHLHVLRTLRETKNAITYVFFNQQKHDRAKKSHVDEYSSLLGLENAAVLIKKYAQKFGISLVVGRRTVPIELSPPRTYLAMRALT